MATTATSIPLLPTPISTAHTPNEALTSGVSWPAVFAGATVSAALALILLALGVGLGLSSMSPWARTGATGATLGGIAIVWLIVMQIVSSSMGGYLAGRLRTKWTRIHGDEVYFRDTAHGFLAWSLAAVVAAGFLASAAASMTGSAARMNNDAATSTNGDARMMGPEAYYVDALLRPASGAASPADVGDPTRAEAGRVFANLMVAKDDAASMPTDRAYLAQLVAARTGMSAADADRQVGDVLTRARAMADDARRESARAALWIFLAFLIGAFCASYSATIGGRQRDRVAII